MIIIESYPIAIAGFILTMICWGSWANTQKIAAKTWRFELFYWDLALGLLLFAIFSALTAGSLGNSGRTFGEDLAQADMQSILMAIVGGGNLESGKPFTGCSHCNSRPGSSLSNWRWYCLGIGDCYQLRDSNLKREYV